MLIALREKYLYLIILICSVFGFIVGATTSWSSPIIAKLNKYNNSSDYPFDRKITDDELSWITSAMALGAIAGPLAFGKVPDLIGRKRSLALMSVLYIIAYLMLAFAQEVYLYIMARVLNGIALGCFYMPLMYAAELASEKNRGFIVGSVVIIQMFGILLSYLVGPFTSIMTFNLILFAITALYLPALLLLGVETPYFLVLKGKLEEAERCLEKIRGYKGEEIKRELEDIKLNAEAKHDGSILAVLKSKIGRRALFITATLGFLQQLCGISIVFMFTQTIFEAAGTVLPADVCPIITGAAQIAASVINPLTTDKVGRKILLYISASGTGISLIILGVYLYLDDHGVDVSAMSSLPIICLVLAIGFYATSLGPTLPLITAEIFPMELKCGGTCLVSAAYWVAGYIESQYFIKLYKGIHLGPCMWIFGSINFLIIIFVYFFVIETKGRSMQQIQNDLNEQVKA